MNRFFFAALAFGALGLGGVAHADVFHDRLMVKVGVAGVIPDEDATISTIGGNVEISDEWVPSVQLEYKFTDNVSAELLCCFARHEVAAVGTALGRVNLGKITHFPPTVTVKYRFTNFGPVEPYVGAGVNYTHFFDEDAGAVTSISYDDSFGGALQAGVDIPVSERFFINLDVRKIWINTDVTIQAGATRINADVDINPFVVAAGIGYKF